MMSISPGLKRCGMKWREGEIWIWKMMRAKRDTRTIFYEKKTMNTDEKIPHEKEIKIEDIRLSRENCKRKLKERGWSQEEIERALAMYGSRGAMACIRPPLSQEEIEDLLNRLRLNERPKDGEVLSYEEIEMLRTGRVSPEEKDRLKNRLKNAEILSQEEVEILLTMVDDVSKSDKENVVPPQT